MGRKNFLKSYGFIMAMLIAIVAGCIVGWIWPVVTGEDGSTISNGATVLEPLGKLFINLMFCVVVPMVFFSISSAIGNMQSPKRAGKILGTTIATFFVTGLIAAVLFYIVMMVIPPVTHTYDLTEGEIGDTISIPQMIINFFTVEDFTALFSRRAMLPLIVASVFTGFGIQGCGGSQSIVGKFFSNMTEVIMRIVKLITYYAPIGFFGFFASLVATYGPDLIGDYSRALITYYVFCFVYMFVSFPLYAWFGGDKKGISVMFSHLFRPAVTAFGTCSSVATIPTNMEVAQESGVPKDVTDIVLPMGATMHMDGSSMSAILKVAFLFGIFGMDFTGGRAVLAIIIAVFSSVAMSGIPGGGGVGELVLVTMFFPDQMAIAYPIALALGNLIDPPATMVNAAGDYVVSFIVARFTDGKDWINRKSSKPKESEKAS
ncbi:MULTISPECIES: dicarboxylate/amino acid:cation symporter [Butyrivibrio]|uniref:dicarboxylate/amino acid:cation symporter n=1 Tax=Butyrivibrio TaxID=830 RepID=UPI00041375B9|nr:MULTISPECIES: dicarboxylate/amino acid:cation symporter [Butyrivibrio]SEP92897.1 Na+/H+-dicarboxylate symporter [Butyrivibrio sp. TB]